MHQIQTGKNYSNQNQTYSYLIYYVSWHNDGTPEIPQISDHED